MEDPFSFKTIGKPLAESRAYISAVKSNSVAIAVPSQGWTVYDTSDQTPLSDVTLSSTFHPTTPVVCRSSPVVLKTNKTIRAIRSSYIGVLTAKKKPQIMAWSENERYDGSIESSTHQVFDGVATHPIEAIAFVDPQTLAIYDSEGQLSLVSEDGSVKDTASTHSLQPKRKVALSGTKSRKAGSGVVPSPTSIDVYPGGLRCLQRRSPTVYDVSIFSLGTENVLTPLAKFTIENASQATLNSDGYLTVFGPDNTLYSYLLTGDELSPVQSQKFAKEKMDLSTTTLTALHSSFVYLGSAGNSIVSNLVWDVSLGSVVSHNELALPSALAKSSPTLESIALNQSVFLTLNSHRIYAIPYQLPESSVLAFVVGKQDLTLSYLGQETAASERTSEEKKLLTALKRNKADVGAYVEKHPLISESFVQEILSTSQYSADTVAALLKNGAITNASSLVSELIARKDCAGLALTFEYMPTVSEEDGITAVKYALSPKISETDAELVLTSFLTQVSFSAGRLRSAIKKHIPTDEAYALLEVLNLFVANEAGINANMSNGDRTRFLNQTFSFIQCILDVHFVSLILREDAHPLLESLNSLVAQRIEECQALRTLEGTLVEYDARYRAVNTPNTVADANLKHLEQTLGKSILNKAAARDKHSKVAAYTVESFVL